MCAFERRVNDANDTDINEKKGVYKGERFFNGLVFMSKGSCGWHLEKP